jgi:hypothetical protein
MSGLQCVIGMEACCGAHHLSRRLREMGHEVRLMSPEYVRPYVKAQKNDDRDAEAIAEAATRPTMRDVGNNWTGAMPAIDGSNATLTIQNNSGGQIQFQLGTSTSVSSGPNIPSSIKVEAGQTLLLPTGGGSIGISASAAGNVVVVRGSVTTVQVFG